ncbi:MAG: hypothetical protein K0S86_3045 [Geminicoccaceae bacterium]|jgi:hypothetical protein|nr:hypothetical protein [Geminicoccaceae bacterium]
MSVQHRTIDDTTTWFQAGDRNVFIGTRVVFRGEEDPTEVVFVTYLTSYDAQRRATRWSTRT